ncbi:MAG TPA: type II secretion system protein [Kofleriaceae bacterium]|nr:type II secretion system protein [Kofleriaceae bacterium]
MNHPASPSRAHTRPAGQPGLTVLEIMVVLAIVGGLFYVVRSGFRVVTKADLVEDATELTAVLRRTSQLAVEHGELHRVVLDLDAGGYAVEVCQGAVGIARNELLKADDEATKRALEKGRQRLVDLPPDALATGDPDEATRRAAALAGHHVADRACKAADNSVTGDSNGKGWIRKLRKDKGVKFKEIWVEHRDDSATKGQVAIYFFPLGSAEKTVIEMTDGSEVFTVLVFGLTGRVELHDGTLRDVNDHMLKNALGDRDAKREGQN